MDKVTHFEIPVEDMERAKRFYRNSFGWGVIDVPDMDYVMLQTGKSDKKGAIKEKGVINGGMMKRKGPVDSPVITIGVKEIDEAVDRVRENGGKLIIDKIEVEKMGYSAYVQDSEGNIIGLWQDTTRR